MKIARYAGWTLADDGLWGGLDNDVPGFRVEVDRLERGDGHAALGTSRIGARAIPVVFGSEDGEPWETWVAKVLRRLDPAGPGNRAFRTLRAELNDGTEVELEARVVEWARGAGGAIGTEDVSLLLVTFEANDPVWRATTETVSSRVLVDNVGGSNPNISPEMGVPVPSVGHATTAPTVTVSAANAVQVEDAAGRYGWGKRKTIVVANNGTVSLNRFPLLLELGDTAALVTAGDISASMSQLRILHDGREIPRLIVGANSTKSGAWVVVDHLPAGESTTFEMIYDLPSAASGHNTVPTLWYPDLPAFHVGADFGRVTSVNNSSETVCSDKAWVTNQWGGNSGAATGVIAIVAGTGKGQARTVTSNTATVITHAAFSTLPDTTSRFVVTGGESGTATGGTTTSLVDTSGPTWAANWWRGGRVYLLGGTGSGQDTTIVANTDDTLTLSPALSTAPDSTTTYAIRASENNRWNYAIEIIQQFAGRGLWFLNREIGAPGVVDFSVPGAWRPTLRLDNADRYGVDRAGVALSRYYARLNAQRGQAQSTFSFGVQTSVGGADGISLYHPLGITALTADWLLINQAIPDGSAIGRAIGATRDAAGTDWQELFAMTTLRASETAEAKATYTAPTPAPRYLYLGTQPADGVEIPDEATNNAKIGFRTYQNCWVDIDTTLLSVGAPSAEEAVYDAYLTLRLNGGADADAYPYHALYIGAAGPDDDTTSARLVMPLNNKLVIDCAARTVEEWNSALTTKIGDRQRAVLFIEHRSATDWRLATDWLPCHPRPNPIANWTFGVNVTGWTQEPSDIGITANISRDAAQTDSQHPADAVGSLELEITANAGAGGDRAGVLANDRVPCAVGEAHWVTLSLRRNSLVALAVPFLRWFNAAGALLSESEGTPIDTDIFSTSVWYRWGFSAAAPANAVTFAPGVYLETQSGAEPLSLWIDNVVVDGNDLWHDIAEPGVTLSATVRPGYYS